jgi:hypothetical protein
MATQKKQPDQVPLVWADNPELKTIHANHLWLSRQEGDIFLTFGELPPVPAPGVDKLPEKVFIRPVARIAVSPLALARMAKLLQDNIAAVDRQRAGA